MSNALRGVNACFYLFFFFLLGVNMWLFIVGSIAHEQVSSISPAQSSSLGIHICTEEDHSVGSLD